MNITDQFMSHEFLFIFYNFRWPSNAISGHRMHAGESKRPIAERTPNSWETERPIDNILIEMAQEACRCPCLELNN